MNAIALTQSAGPVANQAFPVRDMERMAKAIAKSGLFGVKSVDQALALMLIAQAEGRHPATAARDYDIIDGRPAKKAEAMLRDFLAAGGAVEWLDLTDRVCRASFTHIAGGSAIIEWTIPRARTAGIFSSMWERYPRQMLRCRVVSEGVRTVYPMATSGMYVEEEVRSLAAPVVERLAPQAETLSVDAQAGQAEPMDSGAIASEVSAPTRAKKSARQTKADGEDERIRLAIEESDLTDLDGWETEFAERTEHLPKAWLDSIRDWIVLRREEVLFEAASAEMDAEYAASVG